MITEEVLRDLAKTAIDAYIYFDVEYDADSEVSTQSALESIDFRQYMDVTKSELYQALATAIVWIEERGQPSEAYAPTAAQILPQLRAALAKARPPVV